jgi:hypothetical protein
MRRTIAAVAVSTAVVLLGAVPAHAHSPEIRGFQPNNNGIDTTDFDAYDAEFTGGASVAVADLSGDGQPEIITGAGQGGGPHVRAFFKGGTPFTSGGQETSFLAYDPGFTGGVRVAAGDLNGDGTPEIITGVGPGGGPHVRAFFRGGTPYTQGGLETSFFAFAGNFTGGVYVASGDLNGDGDDEIVVGAGPGGAPLVRAFESNGSPFMKNGAPVSFNAYDPAFTGGVNVATGDLNGDGTDEIITGAGPGAGPHVRAFFSGGTEFKRNGVPTSFYAFDPRFLGGARVATGDLNGDNIPEIIVGAAAGGGPHVRAFYRGGTAFSQGGVQTSFFAYESTFTGGVFVAAGDIDNDNKAEIVTGPGPG